MIKNHMLYFKRNVVKCKDIENLPSYSYLYIQPDKYLLGMVTAVDMLIQRLDPGRIG